MKKQYMTFYLNRQIKVLQTPGALNIKFTRSNPVIATLFCGWWRRVWNFCAVRHPRSRKKVLTRNGNRLRKLQVTGPEWHADTGILVLETCYRSDARLLLQRLMPPVYIILLSSLYHSLCTRFSPYRNTCGDPHWGWHRMQIPRVNDLQDGIAVIDEELFH